MDKPLFFALKGVYFELHIGYTLRNMHTFTIVTIHAET